MTFFKAKVTVLAAVLALGAAGTAAAAPAEADGHAMQMHMGDSSAQDKKAEIQMDYLEHRGERRYIDLYNLHVFRQYKEMHGMSLHWGLTVSRAVGSWAEKDTPDVRLDSSAVGVGPAYMVRWTKPLGSKWEASFDATGGVIVYNDVHPAHTRNYGFMWRIGPRVTYKFNEKSALSVAYLGHHVSNGQRTKNPGYNGIGLSIGYRYTY
ncbi:acyloxyacyl hydrolase [Selenomonas infelix]|nr:acyloxyacyl hydrolase [Selenomonas infelix]